MAVIYSGTAYPYIFSTPRFPQKHILRRGYLPHPPARFFNGIAHVGFFNPLGGYDLVHSWNIIPAFTTKPWIVSFESALPRTFGPSADAVRRLLAGPLRSPHCHRIIAISQYAVRRAQKAWPGFDSLRDKLSVIHPNVEAGQATHSYDGGELVITFVGNHFARKGGIVALRMARLALERKLPIRFQLISALEYSNGIYTDHPDRSVYQRDLEALKLPNVSLLGRIPNAEVMARIEASHFLLLPTLHDTYGFSVLEAMSRGIPAIVTATAALPEIVHEDENGFVLPLEVDGIGDWTHLNRKPIAWSTYDETFEELARMAIARLETVIDAPSAWERLSMGALAQIHRQHDAHIIGAQLEDLYDSALAHSR